MKLSLEHPEQGRMPGAPGKLSNMELRIEGGAEVAWAEGRLTVPEIQQGHRGLPWCLRHLWGRMSRSISRAKPQGKHQTLVQGGDI